MRARPRAKRAKNAVRCRQERTGRLHKAHAACIGLCPLPSVAGLLTRLKFGGELDLYMTLYAACHLVLLR